MGVLVMCIGPSGSGKSTSLRNFKPGEAEIFCVTGKRLPFKTALTQTKNARYKQIYAALKANEKYAYVVDDSTYLMEFDNFGRVNERGYDKFTEMAVSFERLLEWAMATNDDTIVYFLHHPQFNESGATKPMTIGKMLDNQLCIEGLCDVILETGVENGRYVFYTNAHGIAKSPMGMLEPIIDNDLFAVDRKIRDYFGLRLIRKAGGRNA